MTRSVINWFDIPAADFERAVAFYEALFGVTLKREAMGPDQPGAIFPYAERQASGAVVAAPHLKPSADGAVIYLDAADRLDDMLDRLPGLGGRIVTPRFDIPGVGGIAHILDTEGNRIGLHQAP
ncbi:VOC family protein [Chthonobacter albigriseus]|uniref:VOC family protein n=1 Tax=Chthonobacter albigriseus TaxID=1683161 RepID=UPI0015EFC67A|nr:VOC family protein [Chthonobacter albigriseus]